MCHSRRVHAELKAVWTVDYDPLESVKINDEAFMVDARLEVGVAGREGADTFDLRVCSPQWLATQELPLFGCDLLIVEEFSPERIRHHIAKILSGISGETAVEIMDKVSRFAIWEGAELVKRTVEPWR